MGSLTEALSDFATIGASCQEHIMQVIDFCESSSSQQHSPQPTIARRTEQAISAGTSDESRGEGKKGSGSGAIPTNLLGESLWMALHGIVRITQSLSSSNNKEELLEETFPACLAVLQHFLKRFPGSSTLVEVSLGGYSSLAAVCLFLPTAAMERKAILSSLCKLSLPSWGKHDPSSQLRDHHIPCLLMLMRIVHKHYEEIPSEWDLILWTFEELSVMSIASVKLSEEAYHGALAITAVFGRFGPFSTCFSVESLLKFVEALTQIVQVLMEDRDLLGDSVMVPHERPVLETTPKPAASTDHSLSRQIMNIGARALYGSQSPGSVKMGARSSALGERTKSSFYEDYRQDFAHRITGSKSTVRVDSIGRLPFSLSLLIDVAMSNSFRYAKCGERISGKLSQLAAASPPVRPFLMDIIAMLTMSHIDGGTSPTPFVGPAKIVFDDPMQSQLLAVESLASSDIPTSEGKPIAVAQTDLLGPLCSTIRTTDKPEVAEAALGTINAVLETAGHNLSGEVWTVVIGAVATLSGDASFGLERTSTGWATCCLNAFKCLKLIASDFQDQLREEAGARSALLSCCFSFGSSSHDLNSSLTAIGLLWTIADQDTDTVSNSIQEALSKLVLLSSDPRAEVRNAAVNTLFSCIVGRGASFTSEQWESFFVDTVFVVYKPVEAAKRSGEVPSPTADGAPQSRYKLSRHHSQDSTSKQWIVTQVVVLRGLLRVLRNFFPILLNTSKESNRKDATPWFQDCWVQILDFAYEASACGGDRDTLDIRTVGVELLVVTCQLSSKAGIHAALSPARVGTNMEVVNGALRSVRDAKQQPGKEQPDLKRTEAEESLRRNLFLESFESLESYVEFIENRAAKGKPMDDTQLQVVHRFCVGAAQLYECCKRDEFAVDQPDKSILLLNSSLNGIPLVDKEDKLEHRFVQLISSAIKLATVNPKARFLNQAQRASLELLKSMALNGSVESFRVLSELSGDSIFARLESAYDETDSGGSVVPTLLSSEAATACLDAIRTIATANVSTSSSQVLDLSDATVTQFCAVLRDMLTPIPTREKLERIRRVPELVEVLTVVSESAPITLTEQFSSILVFGALSSLDTIFLHDDFERSNAESNLLAKSREHRTELLALFRCCFSGLCALKPHDTKLVDMAQRALAKTTSALAEEGFVDTVRVGICVCEEICKAAGNMQWLIPYIFPQLCKLIVSDDVSVRRAVAGVFETAKVGELLDSSQSRSSDTKDVGEIEYSKLQSRICELESQNAQLRQAQTCSSIPKLS
jgi:hypothetical protein